MGKSLFGGPWLVHSSTIQRGEVTVNMTRFCGSGVDVHDLTESEYQLREDIAVMIPIFREALPELAQCYLLDTAPQVGISIHGVGMIKNTNLDYAITNTPSLLMGSDNGKKGVIDGGSE